MDIQSRVAQENEKLKITKSYVSIVIKNNKLWLRGTLPVKPWLKKDSAKPYQQFISMGKHGTLTENGLKYVLQKIKIVNGQLEAGKFNWDDWIVNETRVINSSDLKILFPRYIDVKRNVYSLNTIKSRLEQVNNWIQSQQFTLVTDALKIKNILLETKTLYSVRKYLSEISRCCSWAVNEKIIESNPFIDVIKALPKPKKQELDINPFTRTERDLIIDAFEHSKKYGCYSFLVQFLFFTGARPSEALALQWKHINLNEKFIIFEQILVQSQKHIQNSLKTQRKRKFPINDQLHQIILDFKLSSHKPEQFIFTNKYNKQLIDFKYWQYNVWKNGIIKDLIDQGKLSSYKNPYQTRHTFITLCLDSGIDAKDVANWVGNSPEIIYKHYAGFNKDLKVPEL
ncbi:phage integrase [Calothrix sp. NIES-2100]|uniref:tyrosine-type recombinase/integrase n=1 Tax=Calothrix sp. NIES-2100 TaxID=1954172 RepID=UPI000B601A6D|nr:phage integrase [Calothrix sp. NIES-2100]